MSLSERSKGFVGLFAVSCLAISRTNVLTLTPLAESEFAHPGTTVRLALQGTVADDVVVIDHIELKPIEN